MTPERASGLHPEDFVGTSPLHLEGDARRAASATLLASLPTAMSDPDTPLAGAHLARARLPVDRWNQQAWPPLTFAVPEGWADVSPAQFAWLPVERRIPPQAPILQRSRILAAVEHSGAGGQPWHVQLRLFDSPGFAGYVMEDPVRWSSGRQSVGELAREPERLRVCGCETVVLTYSCRLDEAAVVFEEAWLLHPEKGYHFIGSAPSEEEPAWREAWATVLDNVHEEGGYPMAVRSAPQPASSAPSPPPQLAPPWPPPPPHTAPVARYRCSVQTQVPVTLENVTSQQRPVFIVGSPSTAAWGMLGVAAMSLYGKSRAGRLEGQTVTVPAGGEAVLMDDRVLLRLVTASNVSRVTLRGDAASRSVELEIPYRLIRHWGTDSRGVYLDVVGRGIVWLRPQDRGELPQWLAHLSNNRTWQPPTPVEMRLHVPIVGWCQQDPRFTFGLPERWVPAPPGALADYGQLFHPFVLRCGVLVDAGPREVQMFVIETGPVETIGRRADVESLAATLAGATEISPVGPIQVGTLDGECVVLLRGTSLSSAGLEDRTYGALARAGTVYALWFGTVGGAVGDGSHEAWLPHFESMLATWRWFV